MNKRMKIALGLMVVGVSSLAIAGALGLGQVYSAADKSAAIWAQNVGSDKVTVASGTDSGSITCMVGSVEQVIANTSWDTVAGFETSLAALTNSAGQKVLKLYRCAVLGTESTDDELLNSTTLTLYAGDSGPLAYWDTSDVKHYRVYIPPAAAVARGKLLIKSAYGDAKGTGNITTKAYLIESETATEVYMDEVVSPAYIMGATQAAGTSNAQVVADEIGPARIAQDLNITAGVDDGFLLSVDRATTGTTGGAGVRLQRD